VVHLAARALGFIVLIDETLDFADPPKPADADGLNRPRPRAPSPVERRPRFRAAYDEAMQRDPGVVLAHGAMMQVFAGLAPETPSAANLRRRRKRLRPMAFTRRHSPAGGKHSAGIACQGAGMQPAVTVLRENPVMIQGCPPLAAHRKKYTQVLKDFKQFVMRGNVLDLAVAVILAPLSAPLSPPS